MKIFNQRLAEFQSLPGYPAYLAHILLRLPTESSSTRSVSGLILKNLVIRPPRDPATGTIIPESQIGMEYVRSILPAGMGDENVAVRQTVGSVMTALVCRDEGTGVWAEGLEALMKGIDSDNENTKEVSCLSCLLSNQRWRRCS